ncbi:hypothetical protein [Arthrobacter psychrochitiniphilus]|uniref:hypothetical protein n=1 Tax=Arthrobacter psychrochitiniphilus TaxID=291045 RepID=UPI003F7B61BB
MNLETVRVEKPKLAYNLEEAAEATGYSVSTLRIAIRRNNLIASYANTKPVILAEELRDWLKSLPTEPRSGHAPLSQYGDEDGLWPGPPERAPSAAPEDTQLNTKPVFRTPEEVAPELGVSKTALRQFARQTGFHTRIGKKIMLHNDDVSRLVTWMRERQDKADEWWTSAEHEKDNFA